MFKMPLRNPRLLRAHDWWPRTLSTRLFPSLITREQKRMSGGVDLSVDRRGVDVDGFFMTQPRAKAE